MNKQPIGIFDSGVGGLAIWQEIKKILPKETLIYFADSLYCPWGNKKSSFIIRRAEKISQFLINKEKVKLIVVACNTATTLAIESLRKKFAIPFVGTIPPAKPALSHTKSGFIAVFATAKTLQSQAFKKLIEENAQGKEIVYLAGANEIVNEIEKGNIASNTGCWRSKLKKLLKATLNPLTKKPVDVFVLGCTHYFFIKDLIQEIIGNDLLILDCVKPVALQVKRILRDNKLANSRRSGPDCFHTTGKTVDFQSTANLLLKQRIGNVYEADLL